MVQKATKFFKGAGEKIEGFLSKAGVWTAAEYIKSQKERFYKDQCICPEGYEQDGMDCYQKCKNKFYGIKNKCIPECPEFYGDYIYYCIKPEYYFRKPYKDKKKCEKGGKYECEQRKFFYYRKCRENYIGKIVVCEPTCPNEMDNIGISCIKREIEERKKAPIDCSKSYEPESSTTIKPVRGGTIITTSFPPELKEIEELNEKQDQELIKMEEDLAKARKEFDQTEKTKNLNFDAENEQKLGKMDQETEKNRRSKEKIRKYWKWTILYWKFKEGIYWQWKKW